MTSGAAPWPWPGSVRRPAFGSTPARASARGTHERGARAAIDDQRRGRHRRPLVERRRVPAHRVPHHRFVVDDRVGQRLEPWPRRIRAHAGDGRLGHPDRGGQEVRNGIAPAAGGQERFQVLEVPGRLQRATVIDDERRLVQGKPGDRQSGGGRPQREDGAGRMPEHERGPAERGDQGRDVLDLPLDGIRLLVAAVATTTPVIGHGRERRGELRRDRGGAGTRAEGAGHEDQRRSVARSVEGDPGAVGGGHGVHGSILPAPPATATARPAQLLHRICGSPASALARLGANRPRIGRSHEARPAHRRDIVARRRAGASLEPQGHRPDRGRRRLRRHRRGRPRVAEPLPRRRPRERGRGVHDPRVHRRAHRARAAPGARDGGVLPARRPARQDGDDARRAVRRPDDARHRGRRLRGGGRRPRAPLPVPPRALRDPRGHRPGLPAHVGRRAGRRAAVRRPSRAARPRAQRAAEPRAGPIRRS